MDSCVIKLTEAAHKHGNLNIRSCGLVFFPKGILGGATKAKLGNQITIKADGLPDYIKTDIPTDGNSGRPRWIFRRRSWVKKFVRYHNLRPNDSVRINRINEKTYEVIPENNHGQGSTKQRLRKTRGTRQVTREERRVEIYQKHFDPTKASDVTHNTPLESLNLNWREKDLPEKERTKHVHNLYPDVGKIIYHVR